jgi:hypothetical protein
VIRGGGKLIVNGVEVPQGDYSADALPTVPPPAVSQVATWDAFYFTSEDVEVLPFLRTALERIGGIVNGLAAL